MALATCPGDDCRRVLDIPGKPQSYRMPDGRCAKCNGVEPMRVPEEIVAAVKGPYLVKKADAERKPAPACKDVDFGIPLDIAEAKKNSKYNFGRLNAPVGDKYYSFFLPFVGENGLQGYSAFVNRVRYAAISFCKYKTNVHVVLTVHRWEEAGVRGVRVYRTK